MDGMKKRREALRRQYMVLEKEVLDSLNADTVDADSVATTYHLFSDNFTEIVSLDRKVFDLMMEAEVTVEEEDKELTDVNFFKRRGENLRLKMDKILIPQGQKTGDDNSANSTINGECHQRFRLPKVELQKFSGNLMDWLNFSAQLEKIDNEPTFHDTDKFWYLLQSLEKGSEPYKIVSGYPITAENYRKALDALKRTYGNEDLLLQVYVRDLLQLVIANVSSKKLPFNDLFMKLDSHLRALKSLHLERADPATWLYPLVESSLPEDILLNWQRSPLSNANGSQDDSSETRLDVLMKFMEKEVQIQKRMELTKSFNNPKVITNHEPSSSRGQPKKVPTLSGFHVQEVKQDCIFCGRNNHASRDCFKAKGKLSYEEKKKIVMDKKLCFKCMGNHFAKKCNTKNLRCDICGQRHYTVLCRSSIKSNRETSEPPSKRVKFSSDKTNLSTPITTVDMSNQQCSGSIALQTMLVKVVASGKEKVVRAFLDSGSQRSYLLQRAANVIGLVPHEEEEVIHSLFGGRQTEKTKHYVYSVKIKGMSGNFQIPAKVRCQDIICTNLPRISTRQQQLMQELQCKGINLTDVGEDSPSIELLIGSDIYGKILTGKIKQLKAGPTAVETKLGWTLLGELNETHEGSNYASMSINLSILDNTLTNLWNLEVLGIYDPIEKMMKQEEEERIKKTLWENMTRDDTGRYTIQLPWKESQSFLPSNREVARKRLENTTRKLVSMRMFDAYSELFTNWEQEGFVQRTQPLQEEKSHYLPHRAVIKETSLTTPVRPVFDASCRVGRYPSLNDCLEKGSNYILKIPAVMLRFRRKQIAFVSDIRKAFQMIGVHQSDRTFLRFLWWANSSMNEVIEYQHARVLFGATCSPFVLGAVLEFHLTNLSNELKEIGMELFNSLYVDNCVHSLDNFEEYVNFRAKSVSILEDAQMELRLWNSNVEDVENEQTQQTSVLGLLWNRKEDSLYIDTSKLSLPETFTKRSVLSLVQRVFDPIGFTCPGTIKMKMLLQRTWLIKLKWDAELPEGDRNEFIEWCSQLENLKEIRIPRLFTGENPDTSSWQFHTFVDASSSAFAAVIYLRTERNNNVSVQLLAAKARVASLAGETKRKVTIPRLELMGCLIGARLLENTSTSLGLNHIPRICWTDSMPARAWIRGPDQWGTFIGRRVDEIIKLTNSRDWRFVPGDLNPADLPSRGCTIKQLIQSKWWEGPEWLRNPPQFWPVHEKCLDEDELNVVLQERKKTVTEVTMTVMDCVKQRFTFATLVRVTGWILRFNYNAKLDDKSKRRAGDLTHDELIDGETALVYSIQNEVYPEHEVQKLKSLEIIKDEKGILRVKTKIIYRADNYSFRYPVILPGQHPITQQLIWDTHQTFCHAGVGFIVSFLRRKYWIVHSRRSVRRVISRCFKCRQLVAKGTVTQTSGLPIDRVRNGEPFEITGVDMAGPLILKNGKKAWFFIYTCALYRAVFFDLVSSCSTKTFLKSLEVFIEKYRRPAVIYSDNGTNFRGADNMFERLNWDEIVKNKDISRIEWKFNPSTASWWGGWWERLIRSAKDLLRRTLGKSQVNQSELKKVLTTVASVMNNRPLTYQSENPEDLEALTPQMFLKPYGNAEFPEAEMLSGENLRFRYKYVQNLQLELQGRWKREYLSMLIAKPQKPTRELAVGELVVVSHDKAKRHEWELARILKLFPGKDGVSRVASIKTKDGILIRPVQRLCPLEMDVPNKSEEENPIITRSGREVKAPVRFH